MYKILENTFKNKDSNSEKLYFQIVRHLFPCFTISFFFFFWKEVAEGFKIKRMVFRNATVYICLKSVPMLDCKLHKRGCCVFNHCNPDPSTVPRSASIGSLNICFNA